MENCCLCDSEISSGTSKFKRKLLNGRAAVKVREALKGLLLEGHGVGILYLGKKERLSVKNVARASIACGNFTQRTRKVYCKAGSVDVVGNPIELITSQGL